MQIKSLNIGKIQHYDWRDGAESAIIKQPVAQTLQLHKTGLQGDEQADLKHHGGEDKAVLIIPEANYGFFEVDKHFGFLGENITLTETDESEIRLGDRFEIGEVVLEVSQPRSPCWKLGQINGSQMFVKDYSNSGRVGFYCRVIREGLLQAGQKVAKVFSDEQAPTIQQLFLAKHNVPKTTQAWEIIETALGMKKCLSQAWRQELTKHLERRK